MPDIFCIWQNRLLLHDSRQPALALARFTFRNHIEGGFFVFYFRSMLLANCLLPRFIQPAPTLLPSWLWRGTVKVYPQTDNAEQSLQHRYTSKERQPTHHPRSSPPGPTILLLCAFKNDYFFEDLVYLSICLHKSDTRKKVWEC